MERSCIGNSALLYELRMLMPNTAVTLVSHFSLTEKSSRFRTRRTRSMTTNNAVKNSRTQTVRREGNKLQEGNQSRTFYLKQNKTSFEGTLEKSQMY